MSTIVTWIINGIAIFITAYLLPGVTVPDLTTALVVAVVLAIINAIVKPILVFLTLPITIITLGLFTFVINAVVILIVARIVPGFAVQNFWWALIFGLVLSVISSILSHLAR